MLLTPKIELWQSLCQKQAMFVRLLPYFALQFSMSNVNNSSTNDIGVGQEFAGRGDWAHELRGWPAYELREWGGDRLGAMQSRSGVVATSSCVLGLVSFTLMPLIAKLPRAGCGEDARRKT